MSPCSPTSRPSDAPGRWRPGRRRAPARFSRTIRWRCRCWPRRRPAWPRWPTASASASTVLLALDRRRRGVSVALAAPVRTRPSRGRDARARSGAPAVAARAHRARAVRVAAADRAAAGAGHRRRRRLAPHRAVEAPGVVGGLDAQHDVRADRVPAAREAAAGGGDRSLARPLRPGRRRVAPRHRRNRGAGGAGDLRLRASGGSVSRVVGRTGRSSKAPRSAIR